LSWTRKYELFDQKKTKQTQTTKKNKTKKKQRLKALKVTLPQDILIQQQKAQSCRFR
jgi:lipase chaperone LimK